MNFSIFDNLSNLSFQLHESPFPYLWNIIFTTKIHNSRVFYIKNILETKKPSLWKFYWLSIGNEFMYSVNNWAGYSNIVVFKYCKNMFRNCFEHENRRYRINLYKVCIRQQFVSFANQDNLVVHWYDSEILPRTSYQSTH